MGERKNNKTARNLTSNAGFNLKNPCFLRLNWVRTSQIMAKIKKMIQGEFFKQTKKIPENRGFRG